MNKWLLHIVLILSITSCVKEIDRPLDYVKNDGIVIQGHITNEGPHQEIYLTETDDQTNDIIIGLKGAEVTLYQSIIGLTDTFPGDTVYFEERFNGNGTYETDSFTNYLDNAIYTLEVIYQSDTFRASEKPRRLQATEGIRQLSTTRILPTGSTDSIYLINDLYINIDTTPLFFTVDLDWSHVPGYDTLPFEQNHTKAVGYRFTTIDANQLFGSTYYHERILVPKGTEYTVESYSVSKPFEHYLRGIASETRWKGGLFDLQSGNATSNFSNGAFGFFAVSEKLVYSDTIK